MKRFVLSMMLLAVGLLAAVVSLGNVSEADTGALWSSGPLLSCPDVNGDGVVTITPDILEVAGAFGKFGDDNYAYIYDVANGDGVITVTDDILYIASRFGDLCTDLIERQIALATQATLQYRDCSGPEAQAAFAQSSQFVPNMGIHMSNNVNMFLYPNFYSGDPNDTNDQLRHPVGLICTDSDPDPDIDVPDRLIGMWYLKPVQAICDVFGIPGSCEDENVQPTGFGVDNTDEDNQWLDNVQMTWHTHPALCVWNIDGQTVVAENVDQTECEVVRGGIWFSVYGWMVHLYNYIPNQDGRFMMWSQYIPGEGQ